MAPFLVSLVLVAAHAQLSCPSNNACEKDASALMQRIQAPPPPVKLRAGARPGKLVLVGSGIKGISQFTLEGLGHVQAADIVYYAVADPTTELFIQEHAKKSVDLYNLYGNGKPRRDTYTQMAEKLLESLRDGKYVVARLILQERFFGSQHKYVLLALSSLHSKKGSKFFESSWPCLILGQPVVQP